MRSMTNAEAHAILELIAANLSSIVSGIEDIKRMLRQIVKEETREMATLAEVRQDVETMRAEAARNADKAAAAADAIRRLLTMITNAAASATDLDALKADIDAITSTVGAAADTIGQAVDEVPAA